MAKKDKEPVDLWAIQREIKSERGEIVICGVDEAGRGPLAGPVCAAAVILPDGYEIPGLNDSKQLTDKKRRELFPMIKEQAIAYGIAMVDEKTIDEVNILNATFMAMKDAISQLSVRPGSGPDRRQPHLGVRRGSHSGGERRCQRCLHCGGFHSGKGHPGYVHGGNGQAVSQNIGFAVHKGYGTRRHYDAIREYGYVPHPP